MPLSTFKKPKLGEVRPASVTLQLADRSLKHSRGKGILLKVDKFIFPIDLNVFNMEEDKDIPIIFGRPFLTTRRVLITVQKGDLKLRVQEDKVIF